MKKFFGYMALLMVVGALGNLLPNSKDEKSDVASTTLATKTSQRVQTTVQSTDETIPWFPNGFKEHYKSGVAFKKSDRALSCGTCRGVGYEVVSITDCPNSLYVEGNIFDDAGVIIDWTNDSVHSLQAGQVAYIELTSYSGGARIVISDVSCR